MGRNIPHNADGSVTTWPAKLTEYLDTRLQGGQVTITSKDVAEILGVGRTTASTALVKLCEAGRLSRVRSGMEYVYAPSQAKPSRARRGRLSSAPSFARVPVGVAAVEEMASAAGVIRERSDGAARYAIDGAIEKLSHALAQLIEARRRIQ